MNAIEIERCAAQCCTRDYFAPLRQLEEFVASEAYRGYRSSYDNGWEKGFIVSYDNDEMSIVKNFLVIDHYEGGAGHVEVFEATVRYDSTDSILPLMKLMSERLCAVIASQDFGTNPEMTFVE